MSLSHDNPVNDKASGPVRLPSFEDMVPSALFTKQDQEEIQESAEESQIQKTERLCANMRREAQLEKDRLIEETRRECISIRDKTRRETIKEIREEAQKERELVRQSLNKAVELLQGTYESLYDELEPYFLDIALLIAQNILHYELETNDEAYMSIVTNALSVCKVGGVGLKLHLPVKAYDDLVGDDEGGPLLSKLVNMNVEIIKDKTIADGDCLVMSEFGGIRAGIKTEISRLKYACSPNENAQD